MTDVFTLEEAVRRHIQEFIEEGRSFSVYDITTGLRNKVNAGLLKIPEMAMPYPSPFPYAVEHVDVRNIFNSFYDNFFSNYLDRVFNGRYNVYVPNGLTCDPGLQAPVALPSVPSSVDPEIERRISVYCSKLAQTGGYVTLKQVQSAIKRGKASTGLKIGQIKHIVMKLGFGSQVLSKV